MVFSTYNITGNRIYGIFYVQCYRKLYLWYFLCTTLQETVFLVFSIYVQRYRKPRIFGIFYVQHYSKPLNF